MNRSLAPRPDDVTAPLADDPPAAIVGAATVVLPLAPGLVLGRRYRVGRVLERGGMATVYEGTQLDLVRRIAIKVPTPECATDALCARRFEREARALASLQHPHIVAVYELGLSEEGTAFMAMELVEGPSLRARLAQGELPWREAAALATQLADALEAAHAAGVVHGDVSASNVLLTRRGDASDCKLIDFGAARRIGEGEVARRTCGTPRYVAPELFAGDAPHVASDIFALGVLLREMVGEAALPAMPPSLQPLLTAMLDPQPEKRPTSAGEVARLLRIALQQKPVAPLSTPPPDVVLPMRANPADALRHAPRPLPPPPNPPRAGPFRSPWLAATGGAAVALCALAGTFDFRSPAPVVAKVARPVSVANPPVVASAPVATLTPVPAALVEPVTAIAATRVDVTPTAVALTVTTPAVVMPLAGASVGARPRTAARSRPAAIPEGESEYELVADAGLAEVQLVAALDRWLAERNANVAKERVPVMAMRMGKPRIVFDPSGTSASVTYRKRFVSSRSSGVQQSSIEEQMFFANVEGAWEIVDPKARRGT